MPQLSKGGKYIFGWSEIEEDGGVLIPEEAVQEYRIMPNEKVILISGSKTTGGFVVAKKSMLDQSRIDVLERNPELANFQIEEGKPIKFKGRLYGWVSVHNHGMLILPRHALDTFQIKPGDKLLSIRGSNIAFVMGVKGPIIEKAKQHPEIPVFA